MHRILINVCLERLLKSNVTIVSVRMTVDQNAQEWTVSHEPNLKDWKGLTGNENLKKHEQLCVPKSQTKLRSNHVLLNFENKLK
jgi:hypothetical protein